MQANRRCDVQQVIKASYLRHATSKKKPDIFLLEKILSKKLMQTAQVRRCVVWKPKRLSATRLAQFLLFFVFGLVN